MDDKEFRKKYVNLRVLKSSRDFLGKKTGDSKSVYPVNVPEDMMYQLLSSDGPEGLDKTMNRIFKLGLSLWSEELYKDVFGDERSLEEFIELLRMKNKE